MFDILTIMPRHPNVARSVAAVGGSVYSGLAHRLAAYAGEIYPLHVGDTWMEPADGCRMEDLTVAENPGMHRYARPHGMPALLEALAERLRPRFGLPVETEEILVTGGATGGLGAVVGALVDPGDEVLIAAPYWPLIAGIVRSFHGEPVPVPLMNEPEIDSPEDAVAAMERHTGDRTVALYVSTPNNPTGRILPRGWLQALAAWARKRALWVLSDEVYEDYVYDGEHAYTLPMAPERTFSIHSFSKALGMAGNRVGYVVGPTEVMRQVLKVSTHTFYSAPTAGQLAALKALEGPADEWIAQAREKYAKLGRDAAERLGLEPPAGSTFLFLDVAERLDDRGLEGFLEDCVERGLLVAPGPSFGPYPRHVRVCFTSAEPEVVERGVEVLAGLLGR